MFVGRQGVKIRVELKQGKASAHHTGMEDKVAVHKDDDIVLANAGARHGAQDQGDCHALSRLVLADDPKGDVAIGTDQFQMAGNFILVLALA